MYNIDQLTIEEKIGQMLCLAFHGQEYNHQLKTLIEDYHIGNIIHFARNITSVSQVKKLNKDMQEHAKVPLFISLDHEGGMVRRVMDDIHYLPGAMALSSTNGDITEVTYKTNVDLKKLGFNMNHAPVADINNNPNNPVINSRSYSDDPKVVSKRVIEAFNGIQKAGILPTLKHFPGHGDTNVDSHLGLPIVSKSIVELNSMEIGPFKQAIDNGIDGIMISHILYSSIDEKLPASLSYNVITRLLKEELGFKGLIITDSLTMSAIWGKYSLGDIIRNGINAGNDVIMFCGKADLEEQKSIVNTFKKLVDDGEIPIERINSSVEKILRLKKKYTNEAKSTDVEYDSNIDIVSKSITKVYDDNEILPLIPTDKVLILFPEIKLSSLVDNINQTQITLGKFLNYDEIIYNENTNFKKIVQIQQEYDKIVLGTYNVKTDDFQSNLYDLLDENKTLVVSLRSPYDLQFFNNIKSYVCTFDVTKESLQALSQRLMDNKFLGKLPIQLRR